MKKQIIFLHFFLLLCAAKMVAQTGKSVQTNMATDSVLLQEITVEASKEPVKFKQMPASVTILSSKMISENGFNSLNDVTSSVANLFMPDYGSKLTSPIYIRGIGSRINSPSVGLYVDHVPYFEKAAFDFDFFDIERIEVLRGPQGTEYGRNTMGGIVNIITKSPADYQGVDFNLLAGTYGTYNLSAGYYAKAGKNFAYSLALNYRHNDGFFTNDFLKQKVDRLDSYGLRNRLIWNISNRFSAENILSYENSNQGGYPYAVYNDSLKKANKIAYNQYSSYKRSLLSDALVLKYRAKHFDLLATSSYQYLGDIQSIDQDFSIDSLYFVVQKEKQNMFSQEVLLKSNSHKKYTWLVGAYGFVQQFNSDVDVNVYTFKMQTFKKYNHTIQGEALYHESTLHNFLVSGLTITAGIRLDAESDRMKYNYNLQFGENSRLMADTLYPELKSLQLLPKLAVNYQLAQNNFYAIVSKGYKTGGFNTTFERPQDLTFLPEYSWNYEAGVKSTLFNHFMYADCSLFYIDWLNQQIYQTTPSGTGSMLKNAGRTTSKGLELTLKTTSVAGFDFLATYGFTYAKYISNIVDSRHDYSGNFIPYVPRHTLAFQVRKTIETIHSRLTDRIVVNALYHGAGEIYWNDANTAKQDFYGLLDGRISFVKNKWQFDIWGSNLLSTNYEAFYFEALGKKFVQMGKPLQVGIKLSLNL